MGQPALLYIVPSTLLAGDSSCQRGSAARVALYWCAVVWCCCGGVGGREEVMGVEAGWPTGCWLVL